jgi:hypothetical protein
LWTGWSHRGESGDAVGQLRVINSLSAGRRLAAWLVLLQAGVALGTGAVFLLAQGAAAGFAALCGGVTAALGTAAMAACGFSGGVSDGGTALARMLAGMLLKWVVVLGGIGLLMLHWHLPAAAVLTGMAAALLTNLIAFKRR